MRGRFLGAHLSHNNSRLLLDKVKQALLVLIWNHWEGSRYVFISPRIKILSTPASKEIERKDNEITTCIEILSHKILIQKDKNLQDVK